MSLDAGLAQAMEASLIARAAGGPNANPPVEDRKVPRASVLSQGCGRRTYYYLTGAPEDPLDALSACAFQDGKDFEPGILNDLTEAMNPALIEYDKGVIEWQEQVKLETAWARGSADLVLWEHNEYGDRRALAVYDAKSANPASFAITMRKGVPSESYVAQLSLYAFALGAKECVIAYRKKGGTRKDGPEVYAVFRFAPDLNVVAKMKDQAIEAMDARDGNGPIPARAFKRSDWNCDYCNFKSHCWGQP